MPKFLAKMLGCILISIPTLFICWIEIDLHRDPHEIYLNILTFTTCADMTVFVMAGLYLLMHGWE